MSKTQALADRASEITRRRYNRIASLYDFNEALAERLRFAAWRRLLWSKIEGKRILEVGVGTGKNFPYYPPAVEMTAIDFSEKMLRRAEAKVEKQDIKVVLKLMDVQRLEFEDESFDTVVATFVFCSVPDAVKGLAEVRRVLRLGGKVVLLEHVLSANRVLAWFMNLANPMVVRVMGANINRRTVENVEKGGLKLEKVTNLGASIVKLIEARKV